jgi:tRNA(Ile)-lysidine synthase
LIQNVCAFIEKHQLLQKNSTVIVGVSGGPDSLALLHFLNTFKDQFGITVIAAHVDHMFRGIESQKEMEFVINFCRELNIPCYAKQINAARYAEKHRLNAQQAARECRYQFFLELMDQLQADALALAHHGDDQIETILMNLVRGTIGKGLAGIPVIRPFGRGRIIRPFLAATKDEILKYCEEFQLAPRFDPSNEKDTYTRNRFRKYVLPFLKKENKRLHEHFQYFSEVFLDDERFLEELTKEKLNKVVIRKTNSSVTIHKQEYKKLPDPIKRRAVYQILNDLIKSGSFSAVHIENVNEFLMKAHPSGMLHLPMGLKVIKSYDECTFTFQSPNSESFCYTVPVPGKLHLPNGKIFFTETFFGIPSYKGDDVFYLPKKWYVPPLIIRSRKKGDKMTIKGMNGTKKVKDIFIDKKIPREERNLLPIVENGNGQIIWIPLVKKSNLEEISITNESYIVLQYKEQ